MLRILLEKGLKSIIEEMKKETQVSGHNFDILDTYCRPETVQRAGGDLTMMKAVFSLLKKLYSNNIYR